MPIVTIRTLLENRSAFVQLSILMRVERLFSNLFADGRGRFYGGALTDERIQILDPEYLEIQRNEN